MVREVMALSGANLIEVGTTNKTHLSDYEKAINENTGLLLKVHQSTKWCFNSQVRKQRDEIVSPRAWLPLMEDLGSGILVDLRHMVFRRNQLFRNR